MKCLYPLERCLLKEAVVGLFIAVFVTLSVAGCGTHGDNRLINDYTFPPISPRLVLLTVDKDGTELWQRENGTMFYRFEVTRNFYKTSEVLANH